MKIRRSIAMFYIFLLAAGWACAQTDYSTKIIVPLKFPQKYNTRMRSGPSLHEAIEVSGIVDVDTGLSPSAKDVEDERYLVEFFIDNELVHSTTGGSFALMLDTTKYIDGEHKIIVNLWDKDGPSAIGMQKILIENGSNSR